MEFGLSPAQTALQQRCLALAADFAGRSSAHDRDASHPIENYARLREEGFLALTVPKARGGLGHSFMDHTLAFEALAQGCPATALAFNMHASVVMPLLMSQDVSEASKQMIADLATRQGKLIGGNFSEPDTTSIMGARPLTVRATKVPGGWSVTGRKLFASMLEAADYVLVLCYPDGFTTPGAGVLLMVAPDSPGRSVNANWDVLGMRATRSDQLILDGCFVPDERMLLCDENILRFRAEQMAWFWASYTAVYLGIAVAAYDEIRRVVLSRQPLGYAQPLAYHPDVRRHVARMSAELEAARLVTYRSAWLHDAQGYCPETNAAMFRAKFVVGEAVSSITRTALTLGGAHGIFKGSRVEQLFRDGAIAEIQPPPSDFCLWNMGVHELGLDPAEVMPPLRPV